MKITSMLDPAVRFTVRSLILLYIYRSHEDSQISIEVLILSAVHDGHDSRLVCIVFIHSFISSQLS